MAEHTIAHSLPLVPCWSARNFAQSTMKTFFHAWSVAWRFDLLQQDTDRFSDLIYKGGYMSDSEVDNFPWSIIEYNDMEDASSEPEGECQAEKAKPA